MKQSFTTLVAGTALIGLGLFSAPDAEAQRRPGNRVEKRQNKKEAVREKRAIQDDRQDRATFAGILREYEAAAKSPDRAVIKALDDRALKLMNQELNEAKREVGGAKMERNASKREVKASKAELKRDRRTAKGPMKRMDSKRDVRDDKRDLADDQRDLKSAKKRVARMEKTISTYRKFVAMTDAKAMGIKLKTLRGMVTSQTVEVKKDKAERMESKAERMEDKRERREGKKLKKSRR